MKHRYLKNVATLNLLVEKCVGCERCTEVCPHGVFGIADKRAKLKDRDSCMECGACAMNCPVNAISVEASVGCAAAIIRGWFTGSEPSCDCSGSGDCC
ncbi:4Fe-4S ferredoxin iron-sulfur binding domain protein [Syntrophobotulus glycolicus DSM 8271]|uniref:4Fe-4S ferredoxin iron-sulfur binding domain protein n=1 Tax=Syntrophobotulus glycolicus (strain DSM 8271 / FlGlyR) TaxID=645991 RepID=F0SUS2_SYNGF|nr:mercury methylation ferredoxin HgcB [Syntrophobotulus glycolicus]ADY56638.1 4Fe-4S ferredoxin iron-sulfur binding domain protein [Syntrophobotulus glycolicus DSM 8271]